MRETHSELVGKRGYHTVSIKHLFTIKEYRDNMQETSQGATREESHLVDKYVHIELNYTFGELGDIRSQFLFVDESGFNPSLNNGRDYARAGESPDATIFPRRPYTTLTAFMRIYTGLLYENSVRM